VDMLRIELSRVYSPVTVAISHPEQPINGGPCGDRTQLHHAHIMVDREGLEPPSRD